MMNSALIACVVALCTALSVAACDGQQYVNPSTVQLVITQEGDTIELVNRCNFMPVLLGSSVKARYLVEGELKATLTVTHDAASVSFDGAAETFRVTRADLLDGAQRAPNPPAGYTVELSSGCTPDDP